MAEGVVPQLAAASEDFIKEFRMLFPHAPDDEESGPRVPPPESVQDSSGEKGVGTVVERERHPTGRPGSAGQEIPIRPEEGRRRARRHPGGEERRLEAAGPEPGADFFEKDIQTEDRRDSFRISYRGP
jgi:hypothetical protein